MFPFWTKTTNSSSYPKVVVGNDDNNNDDDNDDEIGTTSSIISSHDDNNNNNNGTELVSLLKNPKQRDEVSPIIQDTTITSLSSTQTQQVLLRSRRHDNNNVISSPDYNHHDNNTTTTNANNNDIIMNSVTKRKRKTSSGNNIETMIQYNQTTQTINTMNSWNRRYSYRTRSIIFYIICFIILCIMVHVYDLLYQNENLFRLNESNYINIVKYIMGRGDSYTTILNDYNNYYNAIQSQEYNYIYYSLVINTYQRPKQLYDTVYHYSTKCGKQYGIDTIYIIWAEENVIPPLNESFFNTKNYKKYIQSSDIQIVPVKNSLNNRFQPIQQLLSRKNNNKVLSSAIFMVDDDIRIDCISLKKAFHAWKLSPHSMVGFYPRLAEARNNNNNIVNSTAKRNDAILTTKLPNYMYHTWPAVYINQRMNMILTKACFLHHRYFQYYFNPLIHPIEVLSYVDNHMNCEDIAMSILVANITQYELYQYIIDNTNNNGYNITIQLIEPIQPIYIEGINIIDKGILNGISTKQNGNHFQHRTQCLNDIIHIYQTYNNNWSQYQSPLDISFTLSSSSYIHHQPNIFGYHIYPSTIYEWFSISNPFQ